MEITRTLELFAEEADDGARLDKFLSERASLSRKIAQYFAILTDMRTPGRNGEGYVCVLRALGSSNAGKAPAYKLPYDLMEDTVQRITSEIPGITHVVYDITGRPTAAVEWE